MMVTLPPYSSVLFHWPHVRAILPVSVGGASSVLLTGLSPELPSLLFPGQQGLSAPINAVTLSVSREHLLSVPRAAQGVEESEPEPERSQVGPVKSRGELCWGRRRCRLPAGPLSVDRKDEQPLAG